MKKKGIILLAISILILLIGMMIIPTYLDQNKKTEKKIENGMKKLEKKLEKKENMLIYVTEEDCELCRPIDKMIKFYEDAYNLEFYDTNRENLSSSELKEYFELADQAIELPAVIYIKDGMLKGIDNKILTEDYFRDYLIDYGFLDQSYYKNDYRITYDEFKETFGLNEKEVLFFYNYGSNVYRINDNNKKEKVANADKVREELVKLSKEKSFQYRVVFYNSEGSDEIYKEVIESLGKKELTSPCIVIIENNKVVDSHTPKNISSISKFLEKNGIY